MKKIKLDYPDNITILLGGDWNYTSYSGSRCSIWAGAPSYSNNVISSRGVCDHLSTKTKVAVDEKGEENSIVY